MAVTRLNDDEITTRTSIALAEDRGWILRVELNGQIVATEHHHDWHRIERRRRLLAGFRLHSDTATLARFEVAKGHEGWQFMFRLNDPFNPSRLRQRTAAAPFVP
jgi:hypothetical protein